MNLEIIDWIIIIIYLILLLYLSFYLSKYQKSKQDYFISGRNENYVGLAISVIATQCSTNSILGAPAFVAFTIGGGLIWLQYELAVPLSMIIIMIFLFPLFYRLKIISVYEYLEKRFDLKTRLIISCLFQFIRVFATAVTVYSVAIIIELITGLSFVYAVLILGFITIIYDVLGGIKAIVYSDVIQMFILTVILIGVLIFLINSLGGISNMLELFPNERQNKVNFSQHGFGDSEDFAFWPMLIGGFFLYISYYGCDQSQVQRELCAKNQSEGQKIFFLNGLFRFPLVLLYCFIGVGIGAYSEIDLNFIPSLPTNNDLPNYNLAVPIFLIQNLPPGIVGVTLVALFAAAMSSIDSVLNSLSAVTMEDIVIRFKLNQHWSEKKNLFMSRLITFLWGGLAILMAFFVDDVSSNVLIAINKIGSLINGPILGVFLLGVLTKTVSGNNVCVGLIIGFSCNLILWIFFPEISWLWWNVIGFVSTCLLALILSLNSLNYKVKDYYWSLNLINDEGLNKIWVVRYIILLVWFLLIFIFLILT